MAYYNAKVQVVEDHDGKLKKVTEMVIVEAESLTEANEITERFFADEERQSVIIESFDVKEVKETRATRLLTLEGVTS